MKKILLLLFIFIANLFSYDIYHKMLDKNVEIFLKSNDDLINKFQYFINHKYDVKKYILPIVRNKNLIINNKIKNTIIASLIYYTYEYKNFSNYNIKLLKILYNEEYNTIIFFFKINAEGTVNNNITYFFCGLYRELTNLFLKTDGKIEIVVVDKYDSVLNKFPLKCLNQKFLPLYR